MHVYSYNDNRPSTQLAAYGFAMIVGIVYIPIFTMSTPLILLSAQGYRRYFVH
ncbi:hypothetical protein [Alteromonas oceanisediminis]|uniref:hypothetical protein n=1 Tax=Alteromonas oceanisediminis TaxID=2836180 RepID=UPI001BDB02BB|nr:hypothetical protein [Alteromonas oceanisediminis]